MTFLSGLRDRISGSDAPADSSKPSGDAPDAGLPFPGYERLDSREVMDDLAKHSQVELEAVERYERENESREPVLDKLRYMRGREPFEGYDALGEDEVVATLEKADMTTIKKARGYERKFANRPAVVETVARVHGRLLAAEPAGPAPAYQAQSARPDAKVKSG
jgi:hypothetical protein